MVVRIRLGRGPKLAPKRGQDRRLALGVAGLLTPASLVAFLLGIWRLGADLNVTGSFAIPSGIFSHWQVWIGVAALLQFCSYALSRYGREPAKNEALPKPRRHLQGA